MDEKLIQIEKPQFFGEWAKGPSYYDERVAEIKAQDLENEKEETEDLARRVSELRARQARLVRDIKKEVEEKKARINAKINALATGQPRIPGNKTMKQKLEELRAELERNGAGVVKAHIDRIDKAIKRATERADRHAR